METLARSAFCIPPDRQFRPVTFYFVLTFHVLGVAGFVRLFQYSWVTWLEVYALWQLSGLGITAGSHRLWAHRSYKAKLPLRILLMLLNSFAHEGSILWWAKDHRAHHKCSDTEADPHDIGNGFMFAHCGWLFASKSKALYTESAKLDYSDLENDPVVMFQNRMPLPWYLFWSYGLPALFGYYRIRYAWDAFLIYGALCWACSLNATWCVNSVAHVFGNRPYKDILPSQNLITSILAVGEGWHNYHHTYPFDYKAAELPWFVEINLTTLFIECMAFIGQAYDLKEIKIIIFMIVMSIQKGAVEKIDPSAIQKRINALIASSETSHSYAHSFGHLTFDLVLSAAFFWASKHETYFTEYESTHSAFEPIFAHFCMFRVDVVSNNSR